MNMEIKKSSSVLELSDLARIIEMQEKDITLVDLSYEKRLESLDYDSRQIKKSTILNLATMGFVANATNLVITGPTGAGKTCLACALGVGACRQDRVLYIRMPRTSMNCLSSAAETIPPSLSGSILWMNGTAGSAAEHRQIPSWTEVSKTYILPQNLVRIGKPRTLSEAQMKHLRDLQNQT